MPRLLEQNVLNMKRGFRFFPYNMCTKFPDSKNNSAIHYNTCTNTVRHVQYRQIGKRLINLIFLKIFSKITLILNLEKFRPLGSKFHADGLQADMTNLTVVFRNLEVPNKN